MGKFIEWASTHEKEFSQYVHENFKIISTKMLSEMRRKFDLQPSHSDEDYMSLMYSLQGRIFNEMIYSLAGFCQARGMKPQEIIPPLTFRVLLDLMQGNNPLKGQPRTDVNDNRENFQRMYEECIDELRAHVEALPPSK